MTARFRYRAATQAGRMVEGVIQSPSRQRALDDLKRQRLYPVRVDEVTSTMPVRAGRRLSRRAAVTLWTRNAATLLGAGVPVDVMLGFTARHMDNPEMAATLGAVRESVRQGVGIADALAEHRRYFDPLFVAMVAAGESSGALEAIFERLSHQLEETAEIRSQIRSALLYPALMAVVAGVGIVVLVGFVVPRFSAVLSDLGGTLPLSTRLLVNGSRLLVRFSWMWLALAVAGVSAAWSAFQRPQVRRWWDGARLALPFAGEIELKYTTARLTRTLGLLLSSGIPIVPALKIARGSVMNVVVREGLDRAVELLAEGSTLVGALTGVVPPLALQMLAVGEESDQMERMCVRVADTYEPEVRRTLRTTVGFLEPVLILGFGTLVGFIALAMLQAIYGINLKVA